MEFDAIVIGSGQAGVPLATRLANAGRRVLLVERARLGGTCVNYGCTPTKTMIASARAAHVARTAGRLGVRTGDVRVDLAAVVDRKDAIVRAWQEGVERRLAGAGERLQVLHGSARFVGAREIEVGGERHSAPLVIINVGARAVVPDLPGLGEVPWLDNRRAMELRELPRRLLVLGGGYIGCEFGQLYRRLGSDVTMIDHNDRLLRREDPDISAEIERVFRAEGIELELSVKVASVSRDDDGIAVRLGDGRELRGSHLLVAVGRRPNTDDLGCAEAGIRLDARGAIVVDDHYRTSVEGVYAVGDALGDPQFTHTAWDDHRILFEHLVNGATRGRGGRLIPYTVFTDPQVAGVGLTEEQAKKRGVEYEMATMPFGHISRAIEIDETAGLMKILIDPKTERIVGVTLVGTEAGELLHVFVALMQAGASPRALVDVQCVHPTFAEGLQSLVMRLPRFALS